MPKIKMIIFDWDDVLVQGAKDGYLSCYQKTLHDLGIVMDWEEARRRIMAKWGTRS